MKRIITMLTLLFSSMCAFAQTDSLPQDAHQMTAPPANSTLPNSVPTVGKDTITPASLAVSAAVGDVKDAVDYRQSVVVMPSPDMVGLINQVNAGVDLFTGKATASLPIYTLKSFDIQVPISLDYAANGVKVDEMGSSVGLSWNLNAGGAITRVMKNSPDESIRLSPYKSKLTGNVTKIWVFGYLTLKQPKGVTFPNGVDINNFENLPEIDKKKIVDYSNWFPAKPNPNYYGDGQDNIGLDTEPDEFYFKFGSFAGKFVFNSDKQILCIPDYKFKIEPTIKQVDGEDKIVAFKVTTLEGYTYYFGDENLATVEKTYRKFFQMGDQYYYKTNGTKEKKNNIEYNVYTSAPTLYSGNNASSGIDPYTSAWHLNKIESPTGDIVLLTYDNVDIQYVDSRSYTASVPNFRTSLKFNALSGANPNDLQVTPTPFGSSIIKVHPTFANISHSVSMVYFNSKKLASIITQDSKAVVFTANANRVDLVGGKKLEEITLYMSKTPLASVVSKKWKFNYLEKVLGANDSDYPDDYFSCRTTKIKDLIAKSWPEVNFAAGAENESTFKANQFSIYKSEFNRMLLTGVDEEGYSDVAKTLPLYRLSYFNEGNMMPKRLGNQQDKYGYHNSLRSSGNVASFSLVNYTDPDNVLSGGRVVSGIWQSFLTTIFPGISGRNQEPTSTVRLVDAKYYALQRITNTLGGVTDYDYNIYGDLKVQSLSTTTMGKTLAKTFAYNGFSTVNTFPQMYQFDVLSSDGVVPVPRTGYEGVAVYSSKPYELNLVHGSLFVSSSVKITEGGNGSTETFLRKWDAFNTTVSQVIGGGGINAPCPTCTTNLPAYPFPPLNDDDWRKGSSYQTDVKNEAGKLLKRSASPVAMSYLFGTTTSATLTGAPTTKGLKGVRTTVKDRNGVVKSNTHLYGTYTYTSALAVSPTSTEIDYFEKSTDPTMATSVTKTKTFVYSNTNNKLRSQTSTNSDGTAYTEAYKYAFDYPQTTQTPCNPLTGSYKKLVDKRMIGIPLETLVNNGTGGGSKVIYDCEARPKYFYKYGTQGFECLSPGISTNPDWFLTYQITDYETFGRPKTIKYACNDQAINLTWYRDKILSKTYGDRTWTYEYNPNRLLEKFTDFDGLVSEFKYDEFFRLKESKGRNGNVINTYSYLLGAENSVSTVSEYLGIQRKELRNKQIMDGFGRTLSTTKQGFSPSGNDIVLSTTYDNYGRPVAEYDPTKSQGVLPAKRTIYEPSPLNRVKEVFPHGSGDKKITYQYGVNEEAITVVNAVHTTDNITYPVGSLYVSTVLDEDGKPAKTYTDKLGRTIMTRRQITPTTFADTKYTYNQRGQVLKTLPPDDGDPFIYEYNTDGSLKRKTIPGFKKKLDGGLSWITYQYDARDRLSTTTDPNGNVTSMTYNDFDEPTETVSNNLVVKSIIYGTTGIEKGKPKTVNTMAFESASGSSGSTFSSTLNYDNLGRVNNASSNGLINQDNVSTMYLNAMDLVLWEGHDQQFNNNESYYIYKYGMFDHAGRTLWNGVEAYDNNWNNMGRTPESTMNYMENGWLKNTAVREDSGNDLQKTDYSYNNRGWLTAINEPLFSNNGFGNEPCPTSSGEDNCSEKMSNFYATINFNKDIYCDWDWGYCYEYGVKDMGISYSLDYQDKAGQTVNRTNTVGIVGGDPQTTFYANSSWASVTVDIRLNNLDASLDAITTEIWNVLLWRAYACEDYDQASQYSDIFRAKLKADLLKQFCLPADRLFAEKIHYQDKHAQLNSATPPQYNGNISWVEWQLGDRRKQAYGYTYDKLDRLTGAHYAELKKDGTPNEAVNATPRYDELINYKDARGNIESLTRYGINMLPSTFDNCLGGFGKIDELTYTYESNSNRIGNVTDANNSIMGRFKGVVNGGGTYSYDFNGNMTADQSKGVTIKYNFLNLPYEFTFAGKGRIYITYDADGTKLRKDVYDTGNNRISRHDYVNGAEYENNELQFFNVGFVRLIKEKSVDSYRTEYALADHLGNNRVTYSDLNGDGRIDDKTEVVQENQYYPLGMQMEGDWSKKSVTSSPKQNYRFNGSEWTTDFDLAWGDHGARYYLPAIGAWNGIDALAESYASFSPFHFAMNNPISYSDPTGYGSEGWILGSNGHFWDDKINSNWEFNSSKYANQQGFSYLGQELILSYSYQGKKDNYLLEDCGKEQRLGQLLPEFTAKESRNAPAVREDNPAYMPYNPEAVGVQATVSLDLITSSYSLSLSGALGPGQAGVFATGGAGTGPFKLPKSFPISVSVSLFAADRTDNKQKVGLGNLKGDGVSGSANYGPFTGGYFQSSKAGSLLPQPGYKGINLGLSTPGYGGKVERTYTIGHIWGQQ